MRTNLRAGEELALVARRHWLVMGWPLAISLFLQGCFVAAWFVQRPWLLPAAAVLLGISTLWLIWRPPSVKLWTRVTLPLSTSERSTMSMPPPPKSLTT